MKKLLLTTALIACCLNLLFSQGCLPDGIYFHFQSDIDNFQINNPGCTEIEGGVSIGGDYITNLNGLSVLTSIVGSFEVAWANSLIDLSGLENIDSIGENLGIGFPGPNRKAAGNDSLISLDGLNNLTSIGGSLYIGWNPSLVNIEGLNNLTSIGGSLLIESNELIPDLNGLENLAIISGNLMIGSVYTEQGWSTCWGNQSLKNLDGLSGLNTVGGDLTIVCNDSLINIEGLVNLWVISGDLNIGKLYEHVGGTLYAGNPNLTTLSGLDDIAANSIENLNIVGNYSLTNCEAQSICDYLVSPNGEMSIHDNASGCNSPDQVEEACEEVGIADNIQYPEFSIYPNPATKEVIISINNDVIIKEVNIYNQVGQRITHTDFLPNMIDVSSLKQGMYVIELFTTESRIREKLIIE